MRQSLLMSVRTFAPKPARFWQCVHSNMSVSSKNLIIINKLKQTAKWLVPQILISSNNFSREQFHKWKRVCWFSDMHVTQWSFFFWTPISNSKPPTEIFTRHFLISVAKASPRALILSVHYYIIHITYSLLLYKLSKPEVTVQFKQNEICLLVLMAAMLYLSKSLTTLINPFYVHLI